MKNYITIFFLVLIDQITKYSVTQNLSLNETHYITNYRCSTKNQVRI